jgi:predicted PurR-regulated permease PerM
MNEIKLPGYLKALAVLLLIIVIVFVLIVGRSLFVPIMLGGYIAMLMIPVCSWMEEKKIPRVLSAIIALLSSLASIVGLVLLVILQIKGFSRDLDHVSE